eukprot:9496871-Prorocentrum_lima.AAC.1
MQAATLAMQLAPRGCGRGVEKARPVPLQVSSHLLAGICRFALVSCSVQPPPGQQQASDR